MEASGTAARIDCDKSGSRGGWGTHERAAHGHQANWVPMRDAAALVPHLRSSVHPLPFTIPLIPSRIAWPRTAHRREADEPAMRIITALAVQRRYTAMYVQRAEYFFPYLPSAGHGRRAAHGHQAGWAPAY